MELMPAHEAMATARLRLDCPSGSFRVPIKVGQAIALAVRLDIPLLASRRLLRMRAADGSRPVAGGAPAIPDAFRRAFEG